LVEPLRPEPRPLRRPTSEEYAASLAPAVRELPPGERPKDWARDVNDADELHHANEISRPSTGSESGRACEEPASLPVSGQSLLPAPARAEPLRAALPPITGPQQYQVQFSTTEEHVRLIERAKALLARSAPGKSLGELHLEAMRLLVASLEKQKFAVVEGESDRERGPATLPTKGPKSRHIPAAVRRAVYERDGARCTYVDERGERCRETPYLELHHRQPFGKRGAHTIANVGKRGGEPSCENLAGPGHPRSGWRQPEACRSVRPRDATLVSARKLRCGSQDVRNRQTFTAPII
jgi:hypothetical protein